jgi:hypothetical protein
MKKIIYIPLFLLFTVLHSSCEKFLEEYSQSEMIPGTTLDLSYLMAGEAYPYRVDLDALINVLSDDVQCNGGQGQDAFVMVTRTARAPYSWTKTMFEDVLNDGLSDMEISNPWQLFYQRIAGCNVVLDYLPKVSGGEAEKQHVRGQALAMRSYYYLYLVNLFGKPYGVAGSNPDTDLAVPLKLEMAVRDKLLTRNTVAEVYAQIEKDLLEAKELMEAYPQDAGIYKMSPLAVHTLLSRMYLYQGRWDEAIAAANAGLAIKSSLAQLNGFEKANGYDKYNNGLNEDINRIYDPAKSSEIIFRYKPLGATSKIFPSQISPGYSETLRPPYTPSDELLALYDSRPASENETYIGDIRPRVYFMYAGYFVFVPVFEVRNDLLYRGGQGGAGLRVAELYLNRAEASIQRYMQSGNVADRTSALYDINTLRSSRYDTRQPYVAIDITDGQDLLAFCRDERRREFPLEGHRWFDLRRYGMPAISRTYAEEPGVVQTFSLSQGDARYVLPIPKAVLDKNGLLTQNP